MVRSLQVSESDVAPEWHIAVEVNPRVVRSLGESVDDILDLGVVRSHSKTHESERHRKPLKQVYLHRRVALVNHTQYT